MQVQCTREGCDRPITTYHSRLARRMGQFCSVDCKAAASTTPATVRVWRRVERRGPDECWPFTGQRDRHGYGRVQVGSHRTGRRSGFAHRLVYESVHGPIPEGLVVRHLCPGGGNARCCNPAHLAVGTQADNVNDAVEQGRTARGAAVAGVKLTAPDVLEMRRRYAAGIPIAQIAREKGVTDMTVHALLKGQTWKHVE